MRYKKLRAIGGKRADLPEQDLHRLRIAGKKLRYTAEFFRSLLCKEAGGKVHRGLERRPGPSRLAQRRHGEPAAPPLPGGPHRQRQ